MVYLLGMSNRSGCPHERATGLQPPRSLSATMQIAAQPAGREMPCSVDAHASLLGAMSAVISTSSEKLR